MANRAHGPVAMSEAELANLLANRPTGAVCLAADDGTLRSHPATVLGGDDTSIAVELTGESEVHDGQPACLVIDTFHTYTDIKGAIIQGRVSYGEGTTIEVNRISTFAFGPAVAITPPDPDAASTLDR